MGILGYKITNPNDPSKYVFFPSAGYCKNGANQVVGMYGFYFASSDGLGEYASTGACTLSFYSTNMYRSAISIRYWGISMRGVIELTEAEYQDWLLKQ